MKGTTECTVFLMLFVSRSRQDTHNKCDKATAMKNFNLDKFLGTWYVVKQSTESLRCNMHTYSKTNLSETPYELEQWYEAIAESHLERNNPSYKNLTPNSHRPSFMKLHTTWLYDPQFLIVFDTDYKHYAGVFMCNPEFVKYHGYVTETYIYSRTGEIDTKHLNTVEQKIKSLELTEDKLLDVNQYYCPNRRQANEWERLLLD